MFEVVATDEFAEWFRSLDAMDADSVEHYVLMLEQAGPTLGFPQASAIKNASFGLRELRVQSRGHPLRVFYAFDPRRDAVLILGGDKTGDARFYETMIPNCERIWTEYLAEQAAGLHDEQDRKGPRTGVTS